MAVSVHANKYTSEYPTLGERVLACLTSLPDQTCTDLEAVTTRDPVMVPLLRALIGIDGGSGWRETPLGFMGREREVVVCQVHNRTCVAA